MFFILNITLFMCSLLPSTIAPLCGLEIQFPAVFKELELALANVFCSSYSLNFHLLSSYALLGFASISTSFTPAMKPPQAKIFHGKGAV